DFSWLTEIEKDLALVMQPRSKFHRLVYSYVLLEVGMTLMAEADAAAHRSRLAPAPQFCNRLMIALLALHQIRLKNFAVLDIGRSFKKVGNSWWIVLSNLETKEKRADERPVDKCLTTWIDRYLNIHRPVLARTDDAPTALWLSSNDGGPMSYSGVERAISATTLATVGINGSPHLFRTPAAATAAVSAGNTPH